MKKILLLLMLSFTAGSPYSQDMELRSRAVALLERAHAVSMAPNLPNLERVDSFRFLIPMLERAKDLSVV